MTPRLSIHAGLNVTGLGAPVLAGCVADVTNVREYLADHLGFDCPSFLTDMHATKTAFLEAMANAGRELDPNGHLVVNLSCHGSYQPDEDGDETDGFDENLLLADAQISDDEIYAALCEHVPEGARVTLLIDACHTGTIGRNGRLGIGSMRERLYNSAQAALPGWPPMPRIVPALLAASLPPAPQPRVPSYGPAIVQYSACRDDETAGDEGPGSPGGPGGTFTKAVLRALQARPGRSWRDLAENVRADLKFRRARQHPSLKTIRARHLLDEEAFA